MDSVVQDLLSCPVDKSPKVLVQGGRARFLFNLATVSPAYKAA